MMKKYTTCQIKGEWDDIKNFQSLFLLRVPCSLLAKCLVQSLTSSPSLVPLVQPCTHRAVCFTLIQLMRHRFVLD